MMLNIYSHNESNELLLLVEVSRFIICILHPTK